MLTRKEAGGLLWPGNRIAYVSSCGFISEVIKGQLEKTLHQETEKSPKRVHCQGSTVCGWGELKGVESCLLKRRCPSNSEAGPNIHMFLVLPQPQAKSKRITGQKVFFLLHRGEPFKSFTNRFVLLCNYCSTYKLPCVTPGLVQNY